MRSSNNSNYSNNSNNSNNSSLNNSSSNNSSYVKHKFILAKKQKQKNKIYYLKLNKKISNAVYYLILLLFLFNIILSIYSFNKIYTDLPDSKCKVESDSNNIYCEKKTTATVPNLVKNDDLKFFDQEIKFFDQEINIRSTNIFLGGLSILLFLIYLKTSKNRSSNIIFYSILFLNLAMNFIIFYEINKIIDGTKCQINLAFANDNLMYYIVGIGMFVTLSFIYLYLNEELEENGLYIIIVSIVLCCLLFLYQRYDQRILNKIYVSCQIVK